MQKTIKKPVTQTTKPQLPAKPQSRKQTSDTTRKSEETDELSQGGHGVTGRRDSGMPEEPKMVPETEEREEISEFGITSTINRKSSLEISLEVNQSNIKRRLDSSAIHMARKSGLRETYFGSSDGDNNVSRSGSTVTVIDWNANSGVETLSPFIGGHNVGAPNTGKKGHAQMVGSFKRL